MRILAVDLGEAHTGIALSDESGIIARPLEVLIERDRRILSTRICDICAREKALQIVVGLPRPLRGGESDQSRGVREFVKDLSKEVPIPVFLWDERFTTKLARQTTGSRRGYDDSVAACYLLQSYLDSLDRG